MSPLLSIVVVYYNIPSQFRRTLYSLSPAFQRDIDPSSYEVIVVDNGSSEPPDISEAVRLGMNVEVLRINAASASPVRAINIGLNASIGQYVGVMIDGARLASATLIKTALQALRLADRCVVGSRGRYLGFKLQRDSMLEGYDQAAETELLDSVHWQTHPERLFDISVFDESSGNSWTDPIAESNSIFMPRRLWLELDGYCSLFEAPGGGYVNLDTWRRACLLPDVLAVVLLGEATFHQFHGGVATNGPREDIDRMHDEYQAIRGEVFSLPNANLHFFGPLDKRLGDLPASNSPLVGPAVVGVRSLESQLNALERSTTWRLTMPLRKIRGVFNSEPMLPAFWHQLPLEQQQRLLQATVDATLQSRSWRWLHPFRRIVERLRQ